MTDALPTTMQVIAISSYGPPENLHLSEQALPSLKPHEVLIQVAYAGVNRPDCLQRAGLYKPPPDASDLPGLEVAGTIAALGDEVSQWQIGDEVCALTPGGGYAEYCATPASHCLPVPKGLTLEQAAALPENYFTVWTNVFDRGRLQTGETLLVHGGASGIGITAIQMAHARGAKVIATAGSAAKTKICQELGAELAINYREQNFAEAITEYTNDRGVDVILDMVGGDYIAQNLKILALEGRLVFIAFLRGAKAEINFAPLMLKRQTITGSTLRPQSIQAKAAIASNLQQQIWPLLETGKIKPILDTRFALNDAAKAHTMMEANENIGKIMLKVKG